mmetsp:Transcript_33012/g.50567  ORF Transcript_33012/g.50567 Transcript_33012/m.50567 type:complete len:188 (+) Transcript_33012:298-861(+)
MSNYHNFGHQKFIPELDKEAFFKILKSNPLYANGNAFYKEVLDELYPQVEKEIFDMEKPFTSLNFPSEGGVTGYFSRNMTKEDLALVQEFLDSQKINILNTRVFKQGDKFVLTVGSISKEGSKQDVDFKGHKFDIVFGEFSEYLKEMNAYLEEAVKYAGNDTQKKMIELYIDHYQTGNVETHKDSQR